MSPLRQQMINAMVQHGFSPRTHKSYLWAVKDLARYFHQSPDSLRPEQIQVYFNYLVQERHLGHSSCRLHLNGLRFLYLQVLHWEQFDIPINYPKQKRKIPELLTRAEAKQIILACDNPRYRMMLLVCYGCGLRVSELVELKVRHIDGERQLLRVEQGKGGKDRMVCLSPVLLQQLRHYWLRYRPDYWLFPNRTRPHLHLCPTTIQKTFVRAKRKVGNQKVGGIHSLRHAYATHQLEDGLPIHKLQQQLGHTDIHTTLRYVHWVPSSDQARRQISDLVGQLAVDHA